MSTQQRTVALVCIAILVSGTSSAFAGRGGFRGGGGGGGGGFRGGSMGGFRGGGMEGFRGGGAEGFRGGSVGGFGGYRGGEMSSFNRMPSFGTSRSYGGYSGERGAAGMNPFGGGAAAGSRSGSYTTNRGTDIRYGAAGEGFRGPEGGGAARGVGGVQVTGAGGRSVTDVGRAGGAVGPRGNAVGGRENFAAATGPRGTAVSGYRGFAATTGGGYGWHNGAYGGYHNGWVHGYWNGHYGGWGYGGYGGYGAGLGLGLAAWGLGSALYSGWGYMPYSNPYYVNAPVVVQGGYDYSQPIDTGSPPPDASVTDPAITLFDQARDAFKAGDYARALSLCDQALKSMPNDTDIHQFRAQILFALRRYPDAAAELYSVLSVGPGWDWTTLVGLYQDVDTYTAQLRALETYCRENPTSAAAHFVLAFQYLTEGFNDQAAKELATVTRLLPTDQLSAQLLRSLTPAPAQGPAIATPAPADPQVADGTIAGTWTARPDKDTSITLTVTPDDTFTWKVTSKGQSHVLKGTASYGNGLFTLEQATGGSPMVGRVKWKDANQFTFQALGGGQGDPGLSFNRSS